MSVAVTPTIPEDLLRFLGFARLLFRLTTVVLVARIAVDIIPGLGSIAAVFPLSAPVAVFAFVAALLLYLTARADFAEWSMSAGTIA